MTWWIGEPTETSTGHSNRSRNYDRNHRTSFDTQSWPPFASISDNGNVFRE